MVQSWFSPAETALETRLLRVGGLIALVTAVSWLGFTDRGWVGLCNALFWTGIGSIALGFLILNGAWKGNENTAAGF